MEEYGVFREKISLAPGCPGVYIMLDRQGTVIYVGKANSLKSRMASYLSGKDTRPMAPFLLARAHDVQFITTRTEKEALILENNLIKKHRPRYNVILRDDKTYYHLSLDPSEKYPRLHLVRKKSNDAALYFGPYPSGAAAKETLRFVQQVFPLRTCRNREVQFRSRPCLEHQIGRCLAPCRGWIDESAYRKLVEGAVSFLQGRRRELMDELKKQMEEASQALRYEEAACLRDRLGLLAHALEKQNVDGGGSQDQDILGIFADRDIRQLCILFVRGGKLLGSKSFAPLKTRMSDGEILSAALQQYYDGVAVPEEIILPCDLPDADVIAEWLYGIKKARVLFTIPRRGPKKALLDMACANAREMLVLNRKKEEKHNEAMRILQEKLSLAKLPRRIECYDISNISGKHAVGAMVVFQDGQPEKSAYRRFRIKTGNEPDDYGMMKEMLNRRFAGDDPLPDLVVVDGGKGQLHIALTVFNEKGVNLDVIGLAKEERTLPAAGILRPNQASRDEDRVYLPRRKDAVRLSKWPDALLLLQRVRDEAHRFAISYHRRLKQKNDFRSILDAIPDIGPSRRDLLLTHFGSVRQVARASREDLQKVSGIGKDLAEKIYETLNKKNI